MKDFPKIMTFNEADRVIKRGDLVSLRVELGAGLNPSLSNQFSWTLLMLAAIEGNTAIGELLVSSGAELDTINDFGETALSLAAHGGHVPFIRMLLTNGASSECSPQGTSLKAWLEVASGLPKEKIAAMLDIIDKARVDRA